MSRIATDTLAALAALGAPPPPDGHGPFADAFARLTLGAVLSGSVESARAGMIAQVHAALSAFREKGEPPEVLAPLANLGLALRGLDLGIVDPLLAPVHRPASRPQAAPRTWEFRACLVAAHEIRKALGDSRREAARGVCADARRRLGVTLTAGTLLDWRKQCGRSARNAAPRDGGHREILGLIRDGIAHANTLARPDRLALLSRSYGPLFDAARNRLPDGRDARKPGV